jgi:hypothetical protein
LEIQFGEAITPGPHLEQNVEELRRRGRNDEADLLAKYDPTAGPKRRTHAERQQDERLEVNGNALEKRLFEHYEKSDGNLTQFAKNAAEEGFSLAQGDKVVMALHDESGSAFALGRVLRRAAKARNKAISLSENDLRKIFRALPPLQEERGRGFDRALVRSDAAVDVELKTGAFEALADADVEEFEALQILRRRRRETEEARRREVFKATLKDRRAAIQNGYRERDAIRQRRVDRAFRAARILDTPENRRLAFMLVSVGLLLTGASLTMALFGGVVAVGLLPSYASARGQAMAARTQRIAEQSLLQVEMNGVYGTLKKELPQPRPNFNFNVIAKPDRVLAGFYAVSLMRTAEHPLTQVALAAGEALGSETSRQIMNLVERGSKKQITTLCSWYSAIPAGRRNPALAAALRHHGALDAAKRLEGSVQPTNRPRESEQER